MCMSRPKIHDSERKEMQGWEIRYQQAPVETKQLPHQHPLLSSTMSDETKPALELHFDYSYF